MEVLLFLADNAGEICTKDQILEAVWGATYVEDGALPQCIHSLRKAFGDQPKEPRFIETIPRRGYRLIAHLERGESPGREPPPSAGKSWRKSTIFVLAILVSLAVGLWLRERLSLPTSRRILVQPFESQGSEALGYFAEALPPLIRNDLYQMGLTVGLEVGGLGGGDPPPYYDHYFLGFCHWGEDSRGTITLQLVHRSEGSIVWSNKTEVTGEALSSDVSKLLSGLPEALGLPVQRLRRGGISTVAEANELFLRGYAKTRGSSFKAMDLRKARGHFECALAFDPGFAEGWAVLAKVSSWLYFNGDRELRESAHEALARAQEHGPSLLETHLAEAYYRYWVAGDYRGAIAAFEAASGEKTDDAETLLGIGWCKRRLGELEGALPKLRRASELRPGDDFIAGEVAMTYAAQRDHQEADRWFSSALATDPPTDMDPDKKPERAALKLHGDRALNHLAWKGCSGRQCSTDGAWKILDEAAGWDLRGEPERPVGHLAYFVFLLDLFDAANLEGEHQARAWRSALERLSKTPEEKRNSSDRFSLFWRQSLILGRLGETRDRANLARKYRAILEARIARRTEEKGRCYAYDHAYLAMAHAFLDQPGKAREEITKALGCGEIRDRYNSPRMKEFQAVTLVILEDYEEAVALLDELLDTDYQYSITTARLRLDPTWDPLRRLPSFQELLARSG